MKPFLYFIFILCSYSIAAQPTLDYVVQTWAAIETSPAKITIHWKNVNGATSYVISRKEKSQTNWGTPLATLDANTSVYEDTAVEQGISYEYKVQKNGNVIAFGYINSGIEIPPVHQRGKLLLLVDDTFAEMLSDEIDQLIADLIGDGWKVNRQDVDRNGTATEIKEIVIDANSNSIENIDAIFCLGHIPVPYSGNYAPDGHSNNHMGAWPVDGYYGDIDGIWTDQFVNNETASQERNRNIPGDGKFDESFFPSAIEIQIGRVDFANMSVFALSEQELLRQYLNKNHAFKTGQVQVEMKAVIDDNFGGFAGEAFAGAGWKSFAPLVHPDNIEVGDYRSNMDTSSYIWSYGCGGGSFSSCSGVATTTQLAGDTLQGIFSSIFGSYFGDWDSDNNLLRAPLAQGSILTNCWNGRPHWYFHHMGLGENIGYSTKLSMNNDGIAYNTPLVYLSKLIGMGLMGDPSLRMHIIPPVSNLAATFDNSNVELNWTASADSSAAYYVYRSEAYNNHYVLINEEAVTETSFIDECIDATTTYHYMVRATILEESVSGSYHNLSLGIFTAVQTEVNIPVAGFTTDITENEILLLNTSINTNTWHWDFGDGTSSNEFEPNHEYEMPGNYLVTLIASNECSQDSFSSLVNMMFTHTDDLISNAGINVFPNPGVDWFVVNSNRELSDASIRIFNALGEQVKNVNWDNSSALIRFSLAEAPAGVYFVHIYEHENSGVLRIVKE